MPRDQDYTPHIRHPRSSGSARDTTRLGKETREVPGGSSALRPQLSLSPMATYTIRSLDGQKPLKIPIADVLDQLKRAERKNFPRHEILDFDLELKKKNTELIVVLDGDLEHLGHVLAGYMVLAFLPKKTLLHKICVVKKYRGQGVAKSLLQMEKERMARRGCAMVQLWVDEVRLPARRLYSKAGFEEVGRVQDYYGPGRMAIKMILDL